MPFVAEPTNNIPPKVLDKKIGFVLVSDSINGTIFAMCPVVAFPVPLFRYFIFYFAFLVEPTNNVPPKKMGAEFGGWRVLNILNNTTSFLSCQVTGYPVPRYK